MQPQLAARAPVRIGAPPKVRLNLPGVIGFFALAFFCMSNVNFITQAMFGTAQVFSLLYLVAMLVVLFSFGMKLSLPLGTPGKLWMLSIAMFLIISTRLGMGIDKAYFMSPESNLYRTIAAQLITIASALACRHLYLAGKFQMTMRILFAIMVGASMTIILTHEFPGIHRFVSAGTQGRAGGFFLDPNRAGQACCMTAAFGFAALVGETNRWKPFILAGLLILIPCVFFTYSRSALVFMALLVMMQFVISPIMKQKGVLIGILILAAGIPIGVNVVLNRRASHTDAWAAADLKQQQERMQSLFNILSGDFDAGDTGHRGTVAAVGLKYFLRSPIIGAGYRVLVRMPEVNLGCHNTFLRVFGEAGIFAGLLFVGAIVVISLAGWNCPVPEIRCLVIGYMAMYSCSAMVSHSVLANRLTNVALGVCLGFLSAVVVTQRQDARMKKMQQMAAVQHGQFAQPGVAAPQAGFTRPSVQPIPGARPTTKPGVPRAGIPQPGTVGPNTAPAS